MDQSIETVIESIPIDNEIKTALLTQQGHLGQVLSIAIAYEKADWAEVTRLSDVLHISTEQLAQSYIDSTNWTEELFASTS